MNAPAPVAGITRNLVVQRWGTPQATIGSVNEPREMEERGHRFNERWTYATPRNESTNPRERVVYWHRYDFVASYLIAADGSAVRENPAALERMLRAGASDRLYRPPAQLD